LTVDGSNFKCADNENSRETSCPQINNEVMTVVNTPGFNEDANTVMEMIYTI